MPCAATPRGFNSVLNPWNDKVQDNPCGKKALLSVAGVDVSAEARCLFHWQLKNGAKALRAPVVIEP